MDELKRSSHLDAVGACVRALIDLEQELKAASNAIARNKLTEFEDSLWRQESLCARLRRAIAVIPPSMSDGSSLDLLREAARHLREQSQSYEKLITQSSRSTAILQHLCSLYRNASRHPEMHKAISREV